MSDQFEKCEYLDFFWICFQKCRLCSRRERCPEVLEIIKFFNDYERNKYHEKVDQEWDVKSNFRSK